MNDIQGSRRPAARSPRRRGPAPNQLGELQFSDWYDTPVFEPDDDELIEEMATAGHGPRRLMAKARLARDARRAKRRPEWDTLAPAPAVKPVAVKPVAVKPVATEPIAAKPAPTPAAAATKPAPAADIDAWATSGPALTDESMRFDLERENLWRRRLNSFLDRWAENEVAVAARLDRSLERVLNPSLPEFLASAARRGGSR
ncbi:MAG TPA: hypothetical protein VNF71_14565 [Acidimicrobiales bacterium]|nr:hypothetical protein [Acidimicrobiales bacterium]